ncbi:rhamnulokinase [Bacillus sp. UMB0893]|uniref:rhamnulokinase n=1 Tax=Bacillus sp. UMB0893 TaxID=2066053 RepID=UPI000C7739AE|nr:rhamnulokinase [Bacillus sp. UMB0893]PLR66434.1 rhamnulokinase [Bacillus sp. UMB0893]
MKYCLAVDVGASSGRMILGHKQKDKILLEEIHRFENRIVQKNNQFCWNVDEIFNEIKKGLIKCGKRGIKPESMGIDTWAIDFVLLDKEDTPLTDVVSYRDPRTEGMIEQVAKRISKKDLYKTTGIQFLKFNTIYQLYSIKQNKPEVLEKAHTFLMIPDYLHYLLTSVKANEYTNATTTQLVNTYTGKWDRKILEELDLPVKIFQEVYHPKTILGQLKEELVAELGFNMKVILPATHDTGSAVIATQEWEESIYISSGTWSLIGVEHHSPTCTPKALESNFTNEGGIDCRYRFLKNIMGLWMIQEARRLYGKQYSFAELMKLSGEIEDFNSIVDVNDDRFLNPENMIEEIMNYCRETSQQVPKSPGEVAKCIFDSLVVSYQKAIEEIEEIFERKFNKINVIGGGCQNEVLNQMIANKTKKKVYAGPVEATAIGNIVTQMIALGEIEDLFIAKTIIKNSFEVKTYLPRETPVNNLYRGDKK